MYDLNQIPYDYTVEVTNRFKGLDLIGRVPDALWTVVHDIVQEAVIKIIFKKKKCKKAKWLSEEALQIAEEREVKGKREKEIYTYFNAKFQRTQRKIRKLSSVINAKKWRKIEWGSLEISSRKIRDTKGIFHAKMGTIKDRNGVDPPEAEDIKKRWQEYTEELYKKDLHDPDNHNGLLTHLEPESWNVKSSGP